MALSSRAAFLCLATAALAALIYEPNVPWDAVEYWTIWKFERLRRLHCLMDAISGEKIIQPGTYPIPSRAAPNDPELAVTRTKFDGVDVQVYDPSGRREAATEAKGKKGKSPALLYFHGGGWCLGSTEVYDATVRHLTKSLVNFLVVSVDYRLAPSHVFPAAVDDVFAAFKHLVTEAEAFGVDEEKIVVAGDSAGGNLAAAISLKIRDFIRTSKEGAKIPPPKIQIMLYPALQAVDFKTPSYTSPMPFLTPYWMTAFYATYLTGSEDHYDELLENQHVSPEMYEKYSARYVNHDLIPSDLRAAADSTALQSVRSYDPALGAKFERMITDPYFAPLMAEDLTDLPPAYIVACQYDVLRDDAILYAHRLKASGVSATLNVVKGAWHGVLFRGAGFRIPLGDELWKETVKFIRERI